MSDRDPQTPRPAHGPREETLRQRLDRGLPSVHEAVEIAAHIALAPDQRPGFGADVRADTILLTADGGAQLIDAPAPDAVAAVAYASPERTHGAGGNARADVWTLGVLLYEMLSGRHPFAADTPGETVRRIRQDWPVPLGELRAGVGPELVAVIDRCLEKDPAHRYDSPAALVAALRDVERTGPESTPAGGVTMRRALRLTPYAVVARPAVIVPLLIGAALLMLAVGLAVMRSAPRVVEADGTAADVFAQRSALLVAGPIAPEHPELAAAARAGLIAELQRSRVASVLEPDELNGVEHGADVTAALGTARRVQAGAVLHVTLTRSAGGYEVSGRGLHPDDGSELFIVRAVGPEHRILDTVELLSREVRRRLGEHRS